MWDLNPTLLAWQANGRPLPQYRKVARGGFEPATNSFEANRAIHYTNEPYLFKYTKSQSFAKIDSK